MSLTPGFRLDRYELLAPIAEGGMGQVWLARLIGKRGFEKLVAIKVSKLSGDQHSQQALLDEARIASAIEHVNVAQIVELGEHDDMLYIVMEWVDGDALSTLLRALDKTKTPMPLPIALRIMSETCAGAHAAHELKGSDGSPLEVVHRDISPQNMLLTRAGSVKLIDFGIAKARSRLSGETTDGTLKGKIKYMAPEQALGRRVDRRADVFSLGCVLYRILTGRSPYDGDTEVSTLHLLVSGAAPAPLPASVPPAIAAIVHRALAHEPDARFQTAAEMQQAISKAIAECRLPAEATEVASFIASHLQTRQAQRTRAIEIAMRAAADRAKVAKLLQPPPTSESNPTTGSGFTPSSSQSLSSLSSGEGTGSSSMRSFGNTGGTSLTGTDLSLQSSSVLTTNPFAAPNRWRGVYPLVMIAAVLGVVGAVLIGIVFLNPAGAGRSAATVRDEAAPAPADSAALRVASSDDAPSADAGSTPSVVSLHSAAAPATSAAPASSTTPTVRSTAGAPRSRPTAPAVTNARSPKPKPTAPDFGY